MASNLKFAPLTRINFAAVMAREPARRKYHAMAKAAAPKVAWPTLALFMTVVAAFVSLLLGGAHLPSWPAKLALGATISSYVAFCAFSVMHEASHDLIVREPRRLRWVNDFIGWLAGVIFLAAYPAFREAHRLHHQHTNHPEDDPNFWIVEHNGWRAVIPVILNPIYVRRQTYQLSKRLARPDLMASFFVLLALAFGPMTAYVWAFSLTDLLLLWVLPALVASWLSTFLIATLPHGQGADGADREENSFNVLPQALQTPLDIVTHGHMYHLLHHAMPGVPFYCYPEIARALARDNQVDEQNAPGDALPVT